jgi:hypothetical protein
MADELHVEIEATHLAVLVPGQGAPRRWSTDELVGAAAGKEWGHGFDTMTAAKSMRYATHDGDRLRIELDPTTFELVVVRLMASGMFQGAPPEVATKIALVMVWTAARRGIDHLFDPLPVNWWWKVPEEPTPTGNFSTHHLSAKVPVFAHRTTPHGSLFDPSDRYIGRVTKVSGEMVRADPGRFERRVQEERVAVVKGFLHGEVPAWAAGMWKMSDDEAALNDFFEDEFHRFGNPATWPEYITFDNQEEILEGLRWPGNSTNRERLAAALVNLHTIHRPHIYQYKGRNKKGKMVRPTFKSLEPLWKVQYEVSGGRSIIVRPGDMAALKHQITPQEGGVPHYFTKLPIGRFAELEQVAASTTTAREANDLLTAFLRDVTWAKAEPEGGEYILEYTLSRWGLQWTKPTASPMAKIRERPCKDDAERELRVKVEGYLRMCTEEGRRMVDKELADHLGVDLATAMNARQRAGIALRAQHKSVTPHKAPKPHKLINRVERALGALNERWPGFIVPGKGGRLINIRPREDVFRVRVRPGSVGMVAGAVLPPKSDQSSSQK